MREILEDIDKALDSIVLLKQDLLMDINYVPDDESRQDILMRRGRKQLAEELMKKYFNEVPQ